MNELIKIENKEIKNNLVSTVNARELHEFLEIGRKFATWIQQRIEKYRFVENEDFLIVSQNRETIDKDGKLKVSVAKEYHITLDMAKELAMVENNDRGRDARKYFIECEKKLRKSIEDSIPKNLPDALEAYALEIRKHERTKLLLEEAKQIIEEAKPKIKYHDIVLACPDLLTVRQIAQDYGISTQKLNNILRDENIQYKDKSDTWLLYLKYSAQGYAQTCTHVYRDNSDIQHAKLRLKWTQKGRLFIYDILKARGILPICEQENYVPAPPKSIIDVE